MLFPVVSIVLLLLAHVQADAPRGLPRIWARGGNFPNSTSNTNTSTTTSMPFSASDPTSTSSPTSSSDNVSVLNPTTSSTSSLNTTTTTPDPTCAGSITYTGSVYPTVFITVTEGFDVTVTASDASLTHSAILVTPLPACQATVVPAVGSFVPNQVSGATPIATIAVSTISVPIDSAGSSATGTATTTGARAGGVGPDHPTPANPNTAGAPAGNTPAAGNPPAESEAVSTLYSTIYGSAPYTSTVVITKKTPVTVVVPPSSNPPVFQNPTTSAKPPSTPGTSHQDNPGNGGQPAKGTSTPPADNPAPVPSPKPNGGAAGGASISSPTVAGAGQSAGPANPNSPLAQAQPNPVAPATTIHNVPVAVGASSILVGTQAVAIPTSGAETVRAGGQLFTVKASEIVASGTTVEFASLELVQIATAAAPTRVTAAPGVVVTVQGTTAVVAGTTYRIGKGASATVLTVSGQTIQLGPSGVVLASTTVPAGAVTPAPMAVESAGGITFSVDASEVVVEGTTYRIGSGAPTIRTTVDGQSLSIGPGGVAVGTKTTLKPTSITADQSGAARGTGTSTASATMGVQVAAASHPSRMPFSEVLGWLLVTLTSLLV